MRDTMHRYYKQTRDGAMRISEDVYNALLLEGARITHAQEGMTMIRMKGE